MKFNIKGLREKIKECEDGMDSVELYEYFLKEWIEYTNKGGDIDDIFNRLSKEELKELFYRYIQHHG